MKLLERQRELELEKEKEKVYLELVQVQNNLKLVKIKKNKIAGSRSSLLDDNSNNREEMLENDILSEKYNPVQNYDRSFCKDELAKNCTNITRYQSTIKSQMKVLRDEAKSENDENKISNSTTLLSVFVKHVERRS